MHDEHDDEIDAPEAERAMRARIAGPRGLDALFDDQVAALASVAPERVHRELLTAVEAGVRLPRFAACVLLAGGDPRAGALLHTLLAGYHQHGKSFGPPGRLHVDHIRRPWRAGTPQVFAEAAGLSVAAFEKAVGLLRARGVLDVRRRGAQVGLRVIEAVGADLAVVARRAAPGSRRGSA